MTLTAKAAIAWLLLLVLMFLNGTMRVLLLQPQLGEDRARQVASLTGAAVILMVSWLFVRISPGASQKSLLRVGAGWLAATLAFEFLFGHFVSGQSWSTLLADYNLLQGRFWTIVLVTVCCGPWLCGRLRRRASRAPKTA